MGLEGQLSDFNLAEILQLLSSQQKSGFLNLEAQREMVFIFDKGVLISTRDRRSRSKDPLEAFLQAYGFFNESEWKHIDYVRSNSSLDLTEILVSEGQLRAGFAKPTCIASSRTSSAATRSPWSRGTAAPWRIPASSNWPGPSSRTAEASMSAHSPDRGSGIGWSPNRRKSLQTKRFGDSRGSLSDRTG